MTYLFIDRKEALHKFIEFAETCEYCSRITLDGTRDISVGISSRLVSEYPDGEIIVDGKYAHWPEELRELLMTAITFLDKCPELNMMRFNGPNGLYARLTPQMLREAGHLGISVMEDGTIYVLFKPLREYLQ